MLDSEARSSICGCVDSWSNHTHPSVSLSLSTSASWSAPGPDVRVPSWSWSRDWARTDGREVSFPAKSSQTDEETLVPPSPVPPPPRLHTIPRFRLPHLLLALLPLPLLARLASPHFSLPSSQFQSGRSFSIFPRKYSQTRPLSALPYTTVVIRLRVAFKGGSSRRAVVWVE